MAKMRPVSTEFWIDPYSEKLSPAAKLLFLYFLTCPLSNLCGIYKLPFKQIITDTGFSASKLSALIQQFEDDNKIRYRDGWVAIKNHMKHQSQSPQVQTGIDRELANAPQDLVDWCLNEYDIDTLSDHIDTASKSRISISISKSISKVFKKPEISEIQAYLNERTITAFTAEQFFDFYESKGWMIGKNHMKDWKAAVRTWQRSPREHKPKPKTMKELYG